MTFGRVLLGPLIQVAALYAATSQERTGKESADIRPRLSSFWPGALLCLVLSACAHQVPSSLKSSVGSGGAFGTSAVGVGNWSWVRIHSYLPGLDRQVDWQLPRHSRRKTVTQLEGSANGSWKSLVLGNRPATGCHAMNRKLAYLLLLSIGALSACSEVVLEDVSAVPEYKDLVGSRYEVVGTVDAYGIRRHSKADVEYITLVPPPGFGGSEVGFRVRIELGSKVTIDKVMKTNRWFDCGMAFIVTLESESMSRDEPTRIEMSRGNEGADCLSFNPGVYRRMP